LGLGFGARASHPSLLNSGGGGGAGAGVSGAGVLAEDAELLATLMPRLEAEPAVSFAAVAAAAHAHGRRALAAQLLQREPRASEQVPLLLEMGLHAPALQRAVASHEADLVFLALLSAKQALPPIEFAQLVCGQPSALTLYASYAGLQDRSGLKGLYTHAGRSLDAARVALRDAYRCSRPEERLRALGVASELLALDRALSGAPAAREAAEAQALLRSQIDLELATIGLSPPDSALLVNSGDCLNSGGAEAGRERDFANSGVSFGDNFGAYGGFAQGLGVAPPPEFRFIDTSLSQTLHTCFLYSQGRRAAKLRSEFRVPDKRFWHIKIRALASCRDWEALEELARERKSPVGYGPFIEACVAAGNLEEGKKYISRLGSAREKATFLVRFGCVDEARELAVLSKDSQLLESIARDELR